MTEVSLATGLSGTVDELRPARISDRLVAFFLDLLPFLGGFGVHLFLTLLRQRAAQPAPGTVLHLGALWIALSLAYQFAGNLSGGTVGKRLLGLRVVRRDGRPLRVVRSLVRAVGYLLSMPLCNFGFLIAFVHPQSRTLHDLLSGALVVESRAKNPAEAFIVFLAAAGVLSALFAGNLYFGLHRPLPSDVLAVKKAEAGLGILAQIEEAYKAKNGAYTNSLADLVEASGNPEEFRKAMAAIFEPNFFRVEAGRGRYRISGVAKDHDQTRVVISGPRPSDRNP